MPRGADRAHRCEQTEHVPERNGLMFTLFSDINLTDSTMRPGRMRPFSLFGDIEVDLKSVQSAADGIEITAIAPLGNVDVFVPDNVEVTFTGFTLLGSRKVAVPDSTEASQIPPVRVRGFSVFGSLRARAIP